MVDTKLLELIAEQNADVVALLERLLDAQQGADEAHLDKFLLEGNTKDAVPLWPKAWVETRGGRLYVKEGAPKSAVILPVSMTGGAGSFTLRSADRVHSNEPTETITPDLSDPAYIQRWLGVRHRVGASLFAYNTSAVAASTLTCWFFHRGRQC